MLFQLHSWERGRSPAGWGSGLKTCEFWLFRSAGKNSLNHPWPHYLRNKAPNMENMGAFAKSSIKFPKIIKNDLKSDFPAGKGEPIPSGEAEFRAAFRVPGAGQSRPRPAAAPQNQRAHPPRAPEWHRHKSTTAVRARGSGHRRQGLATLPFSTPTRRPAGKQAYFATFSTPFIRNRCPGKVQT